MSAEETRSGGGKGCGSSRREFLLAAAGAFGCGIASEGPADGPGLSRAAPSGPLRLGLATYNLARSWNLPTIIKNCAETKFQCEDDPWRKLFEPLAAAGARCVN